MYNIWKLLQLIIISNRSFYYLQKGAQYLSIQWWTKQQSGFKAFHPKRQSFKINSLTNKVPTSIHGQKEKGIKPCKLGWCSQLTITQKDTHLL